MRFKLSLCGTLPKLSWCAHLRRGSDVVSVYHGPWVEIDDGWFVEGAWTGPFEKREIDSALFNIGSGGVIRVGRAVFCTPTDMIGRLYSIRVGADLFISNSLVFVLTMAGDEPDPSYPFYGSKLNGYLQVGLDAKNKTFCTRLGRKVALHEYCQIAIDNDLRLSRIEKPVFPQPGSFKDYVSMLEGVLRAVLENAGSPSRRHARYQGLATVSSGYDSNAVAALLAKAGVREAVTFYDAIPGKDSGEEIARLLGMNPRVYARQDFQKMSGIDEAEFLSWPDKRSDIVFAPCEKHLVAKVLVKGNYGDVVFGATRYKKLGSGHMGGSRITEFRLRVGFLHFNPLYTGGLHLSAMRRIATSQEMAPWRLGKIYDRPIPRRIIEEAGVPRGSFGTTKAFSAFYEFNSPADMSPEGRAAFELYRHSMPRPTLLRRAWYWGLIRLRPRCETLGKTIKSFWWTGGTAAESLIPSHYRAYDDMDFATHWGQARVRERYVEAVTAHAKDL